MTGEDFKAFRLKTGMTLQQIASILEKGSLRQNVYDVEARKSIPLAYELFVNYAIKFGIVKAEYDFKTKFKGEK